MKKYKMKKYKMKKYKIRLQKDLIIIGKKQKKKL